MNVDENRRAEPEVAGGGTGKRNVQLSMVETFIRDSKERNRFRSDKTCSCSLSSIVHDDVFVVGKDKKEVKVKRSRCGEDRK